MNDADKSIDAICTSLTKDPDAVTGDHIPTLTVYQRYISDRLRADIVTAFDRVSTKGTSENPSIQLTHFFVEQW